MKESDVLDELMASLVQKYDFEFRVEELFKAPVETLEDQELDDFMNELIEVRDGIGKKLALARRFCCKSREKWERCDAVLDHIGHRILANPAFMEIFLSPISARFEVQFDALLNDL